MGNLRDQMEALTQGIATSARERKMAVGDSKAQTARTLQAFGRERMAMAKDLKSGFVADGVSRSANVHTILANTGTMCDGFRKDHVRMQRSLRRRLVQSTEAVATFVASLHADFAKGRADFANAHRHMTQAHRAELDRGVREEMIVGECPHRNSTIGCNCFVANANPVIEYHIGTGGFFMPLSQLIPSRMTVQFVRCPNQPNVVEIEPGLWRVNCQYR